MKIFVPTIGDKIILTEDWTFDIKQESRNWELANAFGNELVRGPVNWGWTLPWPMTVTLPAGTVLSVQRIYIRGHARQFDSFTFRTIHSPDGRLATKRNGGDKDGKGRRFFASLDDVNRIEAERFEE
jgi:hypothetical protein